ncbi:hypothetical protein [Streptomyces sp. NPDC005538]|uniref:hypothetical protein n=1 Tax=unclassified Streptomyces TaxID=2593676 RepID=UPI00339F1323
MVESSGTLSAAFYGEFAPHAWHDPEHDAYQLFHRRSQAMGWLDRLWGMNDAGQRHPLGVVGTRLVSWFQVDAGAVGGELPLPVRPFLSCAESVTARIGRVEVDTVQVLLPVQAIDTASRPAYARVPSLLTVEWFAGGDPRARVPVRVAVSGGGAPASLAERVAGLDQDVFVRRSHTGTGAVPDDLPPPPFDDSFWGGPAPDTLVLRGELAEWSCDAVGWLGEVLAECAAAAGARAPLLVTVARDR